MVTTGLRGIFVGQASQSWQSGYQRLTALRLAGCEIECLSEGIGSGWNHRIQNRIRRVYSREIFPPAAVQSYNAMLQARLAGSAVDFIWFEWPVKMELPTLEAIRQRWPNCQLACFQDDNPFGDRPAPGGFWDRFLTNLPFYDVHFVKRESDVVEYRRRGAKRTHLLMHGVFEQLFQPRPKEWAGSYLWPVSFTGTALDHRIGAISELIGQHRVPLHVFGGKWRGTWVGLRHWPHFSPIVTGENYVRTLWDSAISLAFISSSNRDEYSMRTFEIPGCASFMLAERTPKHQELFTEGEEAEYFATTEECADKIRFYLAHDEARIRIARGGYARCLRSDYSLTSRMREVLRMILAERHRAIRTSC